MNAKNSAKPSPLGRGLSALFGDTDAAFQARATNIAAGNTKTSAAQAASSSSATAPTASASASVASPPTKPERAAPYQMPIEWLQPGAYQPRRRFTEEPLSELADSIRERGVFQPLLVRPLPGEKDAYEIVAGERRWRASQLAGLHQVPVVVREMTDREAMEVGLIENVQREGLSPLEEAEGYRRLIEEFNYTQETLSKIVGKSRSHLSNIMRILNLPDKIKKMIDDGLLTSGHARTIAGSKFPEELAAKIVKYGFSVRQAEQALKREVENRKSGMKPEVQKQEVSVAADLMALEKEMATNTGLKTKLTSNGTKGSVTFYYQDLDQMDAILSACRNWHMATRR